MQIKRYYTEFKVGTYHSVLLGIGNFLKNIRVKNIRITIMTVSQPLLITISPWLINTSSRIDGNFPKAVAEIKGRKFMLLIAPAKVTKPEGTNGTNLASNIRSHALNPFASVTLLIIG